VRDFTLHERAIRKEGLRQSDFYKFPALKEQRNLIRLIHKTERIYEQGFRELKLSEKNIKGKATYYIETFEHELALRIVSKNIRSLTRVRQSNRLSIVRSFKLLLEEGVDYQIAKFDLESFYESIDVSMLFEKLRQDRGFSRSSLKLLRKFLERIAALGVVGLPRGLAISATLAEYVMRDFDKVVSKKQSVFFYSRFVDDIIIVTKINTAEDQLIDELLSELPSGLELNKKKTQICTLSETVLKNSEDSQVIESISYLGFSFSIHKRKRDKDNEVRRQVLCDIAQSKQNKIKTRIVLSLLQFCRDKNFSNLHDRLKLLSGNYSIYDHGRKVKRKAGIYFNYKLVDGHNSQALQEIDFFLKKILLSRDGKISSQVNRLLSKKERRQLLKIGFQNGFNKRAFYNFSGKRITELMNCWK